MPGGPRGKRASRSDTEHEEQWLVVNSDGPLRVVETVCAVAQGVMRWSSSAARLMTTHMTGWRSTVRRFALFLILLASPASAELFDETARLAGGVAWSEQHCQLETTPAAKRALASFAHGNEAAFKARAVRVWIELNTVSGEIGNDKVCKKIMPSLTKFNESFGKK